MAVQAHGDIRPTHAGGCLSVKLILLPMGHILEIEHPGIVVVLAWEHALVYVLRVDIGECVLVCIPAAKTHI